MVIVRSVHDVPIRLTRERWEHIAGRHPEMRGQRNRVLETVAEPDLIQQGDGGELLAVRRFPDTPLTEKYLVVPYRKTEPGDGFIITAYLTNQPSTRRPVLWKR